MPVSIPVEVLPVLESLGIRDAANTRWCRAEAWPLRRTHAHAYCECHRGGRKAGVAAAALPPETAQASVRVELTFTWLANRRVFIGQCAQCGTIFWRDAVSDNGA